MKINKKIVFRRLPEFLNEEEFLEQIDRVSDFSYFRFCEKHEYEYGSCRAYIEFQNEDDMYSFKEANETKLFNDSKGNVGPGIIEFAVCQKVPLPAKDDSKVGTIDNDSEFKKFLRELENEEKNNTKDTPETILEEIKAKEVEQEKLKQQKTALLDYLSSLTVNEKNQFIEPKKNETKRSNSSTHNPKTTKKDYEQTNKSESNKYSDSKFPISKENVTKNKETKKSHIRSDLYAYANAYESSKYEDNRPVSNKSSKKYYGKTGWTNDYNDKKSSKGGYGYDYRYDYDYDYDYYGGSGGGGGGGGTKYTEYYGRSRSYYPSNKKLGSNNNNSYYGSGSKKPPSYKRD